MKVTPINKDDIKSDVDYLVRVGKRFYFVSPACHDKELGWYFDCGRRGHPVYTIEQVEELAEIT